MPEPTRLFVGNLPFGTSENDLSEEFSFYGAVKNVELKHKKVVDGESNSLFAFVTLESDIQSVNKCIQEFSETKWKGSFLNISVARESFMEKLKREREDEERKKQNKAQTLNAFQNDTHSESSWNVPELPAFKTITKKVPVNGTTGTDYSTNDVTNFVHPKAKNYQETKEPVYRKPVDIDEPLIEHQPLNRNHAVEPKAVLMKRKLRIEPVFKVPPEAIKPQEVKIMTVADEKRLKSIQNMKAAYNEKKSLIKIALSGVDKKVNKILFDEDGDVIPKDVPPIKGEASSVEPKRKHNEGHKKAGYDQPSATKKIKKSLFEETGSGDEDDNINFEIKEQFQGESGQKLMQLQARFQSDKRFVLDERFIEDQEADAEEGTAHGDDNVEGMEDEERVRQMEILQGILGTTVRTSSKFPASKDSDPNKKILPVKTMLRFDPNRPDHDKFMSKPAGTADGQTKKSKKERKREKLMALEEAEKTEEKAAPEVSQERYYKVNESLKQAMEEQKPFSLLSLFGNREPEDDGAQNAEYSTVAITKSNDKFMNPLHEKNPFVYDSSDDEDTTKKSLDKQNIPEESPYGAATPKAILVTENFFFADMDPRFKEGLDFFLSAEPRSEKSREELKFLVKRRIQNNMRNERTHFKKVQQRHPAKTTKFRRK